MVFSKVGGVKQVQKMGYKPSHHKKGTAEWMREKG